MDGYTVDEWADWRMNGWMTDEWMDLWDWLTQCWTTGEIGKLTEYQTDLLQDSDARLEAEGKTRVFIDFPRRRTLLDMPVTTTLFYCCLYHYHLQEVIFLCVPLHVPVYMYVHLRMYMYEWLYVSQCPTVCPFLCHCIQLCVPLYFTATNCVPLYVTVSNCVSHFMSLCPTVCPILCITLWCHWTYSHHLLHCVF